MSSQPVTSLAAFTDFEVSGDLGIEWSYASPINYVESYGYKDTFYVGEDVSSIDIKSMRALYEIKFKDGATAVDKYVKTLNASVFFSEVVIRDSNDNVLVEVNVDDILDIMSTSYAIKTTGIKFSHVRASLDGDSLYIILEIPMSLMFQTANSSVYMNMIRKEGTKYAIKVEVGRRGKNDLSLYANSTIPRYKANAATMVALINETVSVTPKLYIAEVVNTDTIHDDDKEEEVGSGTHYEHHMRYKKGLIDVPGGSYEFTYRLPRNALITSIWLLDRSRKFREKFNFIDDFSVKIDGITYISDSLDSFVNVDVFDLNSSALGIVNLGPHKLTSDEPNSSGVDGSTNQEDRLDLSLHLNTRTLAPNEDRLSMSVLVTYKIPSSE